MAAVESVKNACRACWWKCKACLSKGAPPTPCEDVEELFDALGVQERHKMQIYNVFHDLRQSEQEEVVKVATELDAETVLDILNKRRRWVEPLLKQLLQLGNIEDNCVTWDNFLYIFLRFCSLSRVELCQCLFMIIGKEVDTETPHYLKMQDLENFYKFYAKSPVPSFNTRSVDFSKFPHKRYYVNDFAELCQRYTQLLNPMVHLQRCLQEKLPSVEFWDSYNREEVFVRKITFEFFTMEKTRLHLRGEPPFRESCLMLAPESLGGDPINKDQWNSRTYGSHERTAALNEGAGIGPDGMLPPPGFQYRSLAQKSVWGEHPLPEEIKKAAQLAEERRRMKPQKAKEKMNMLWSAGSAPAGSPPQPDTGAQEKRVSDKPEDRKAEQELALAVPGQPAPNSAVAGLAIGRPRTNEGSRSRAGGPNGLSTAPANGNAMPGMDVFVDNPSELALLAASLNEDLAPPVDVLPPPWMKNFATAPAPRHRGPDPPLRSAAERRSMSNTFNTTNGLNTTNGFSTTRVTFADEQPPR